ncbi:dihydrofolate reductase family protein [Pseudoneobacillus sp. C159]
MNQNRKIFMFIAASLDGYIATKEESLEWLFKVEGEGDNGYSEFYQTIDTIIMGKKTYDWIMNQEQGNFPYKNKQCYVFTRANHDDTEYVKFVNGDVVEFVDSLDGQNIWVVGGGELLYFFLKEQLVDEIIVTLAPVLIGNGIPLFREAEYYLDLKLKGTRTFNQFVELHYEVKK